MMFGYDTAISKITFGPARLGGGAPCGAPHACRARAEKQEGIFFILINRNSLKRLDPKK
jgi:hypothetical protein